MPSSYTHYRFGRDVLALLPPERREAICRHRALFDLGLHGPDLFFFHKPYQVNSINAMGRRMHTVSGKEVFHRFAVLRERTAHPEAVQAYLDGFLCHVVLDSVCHPYVTEITANSSISHMQLEMELDRAFLVADGHDPLRQSLTAHLRPTAQCAGVVAELFPQLTSQQALQCIRQMISYEALLLAPGKPKRLALQQLFRAMGQESTFGARMMSEKPRSACVPLVARLQQRYDSALPLAAELLSDPDLSHSQYQLNFAGIAAEEDV